MRVINLISGPGAGKSVLAAELFSFMKKNQAEVEFASEYAKDMVYESRTNILEDQLYVLAKQNRRLSRLEGKVTYAICDSPLILCPIYMRDGYYSGFKDLALQIFNGYDNVTLFLERPQYWFYSSTGRTQKDDAEARFFDRKIKSFLIENKIPFHSIVSGAETVDMGFMRKYIFNNPTQLLTKPAA